MEEAMIEHSQSFVEAKEVILLDEPTLLQVKRWVSACEGCADNAAITLEYILDALTGYDPAVTEYVLYQPMRCPACSGEITEKTLVVV